VSFRNSWGKGKLKNEEEIGMFGRMLLANLSSGTIQERAIEPGVISRYLGGKGLGVYLLDELGKEGGDPVAFCYGALYGYPLPDVGTFHHRYKVSAHRDFRG
jgi:aldehyde:ferredoxin oxidoreductase